MAISQDLQDRAAAIGANVLTLTEDAFTEGAASVGGSALPLEMWGIEYNGELVRNRDDENRLEAWVGPNNPQHRAQTRAQWLNDYGGKPGATAVRLTLSM